jgi:hypothetical protein
MDKNAMAQSQESGDNEYSGEAWVPDDVFYVLETLAIQTVEEEQGVSLDESEYDLTGLEVSGSTFEYELARSDSDA